MATFTRSDDLQGGSSVDADLRGTRFVGAHLSGVVMRGVQVEGADIDAPWLCNGETFLRVADVDVIPFVEAESTAASPGSCIGLRLAGWRSSTGSGGRPRVMGRQWWCHGSTSTGTRRTCRR